MTHQLAQVQSAGDLGRHRRQRARTGRTALAACRRRHTRWVSAYERGSAAPSSCQRFRCCSRRRLLLDLDSASFAVAHVPYVSCVPSRGASRRLSSRGGRPDVLLRIRRGRVTNGSHMKRQAAVPDGTRGMVREATTEPHARDRFLVACRLAAAAGRVAGCMGVRHCVAPVQTGASVDPGHEAPSISGRCADHDAPGSCLSSSMKPAGALPPARTMMMSTRPPTQSSSSQGGAALRRTRLNERPMGTVITDHAAIADLLDTGSPHAGDLELLGTPRIDAPFLGLNP